MSVAVYKIMRNKILRSDLTDEAVVADLREKIGILYAGGSLTSAEAKSLYDMLPSVEETEED